MNAAEMNVEMMDRLSAFVARHKLAGFYHQRPGDVPTFRPEGLPLEVVADPTVGKFDLWSAETPRRPLRFGLTGDQAIRIIRRYSGVVHS